MKNFSEFFLTGRLLDLALADLGYTLQTSQPFIKPAYVKVPETLAPLLQQLSLAYEMGSEQAKREAIVGPILANAVATVGHSRIQTEAPVSTDELTGNVDYWIAGTHTVLIAEAKNHDIARGLGQLAAQLIATVQQPDVGQPPYGIVTSGDLWRFATIDDKNKTVIADQAIYSIPLQLEEVFQKICSIVGTDDASSQQP